MDLDENLQNVTYMYVSLYLLMSKSLRDLGDRDLCNSMKLNKLNNTYLDIDGQTDRQAA